LTAVFLTAASRKVQPGCDGHAATLTEKYLRRGTHRSTRQREAAIRHYLDVCNADPQPFIWSMPADEILAQSGTVLCAGSEGPG
jgi:hypothetical protein